MGYKELNSQTNEKYEERLELVVERLEEISRSDELEKDFADYFRVVSEYLLLQSRIAGMAMDGSLQKMSEAEGKELNDKLYTQFTKENYGTSYANPAYSVKVFGQEYGQHFAAILNRISSASRYVFEGNIEYLCIYAELVVELYTYFESDEAAPKVVDDCLHSFMHDYMEIFTDNSINRSFTTKYDYEQEVVENSDISNNAYLYQYGLFVGENEIRSREYLATFSDEEIQSMADTFTEGYRMGFAACNKDITKKSFGDIRYPLGFERVIRCAIRNFEKINLKAILMPYSTSVNKQYDYDHKEDDAIWLDREMGEYSTECRKNAFERIKDIAPGYGGPAVMEVFGEEPFSPEAKAENPAYSDSQQEIRVKERSEYLRLVNKYIHGEERSFTIISFPVAAIGDKYEELFSETVKINTLDYKLYQTIQQKLIDVLDTADRVHILGCGDNRTDLYVKIHELPNPDRETAFENCVADVNIPVGEVFTSPVLEGTNGKLHVTQVFLNELNYKNLEIDFKDGMIDSYTCTNFDNEEENKKYIADNVLFHHDTLPMGEFAIGTNTTAYRVGRVYDIQDKLPILIAEKTGPHFAVGDTCYTYDEDNITYNPDGKAIIARDNSVSILRKTDVSKAYFNCHTDITIPYNELGAITVIRKDGSTEDIIRDGKFVLAGTEELNKPLDELDTWEADR